MQVCNRDMKAAKFQLVQTALSSVWHGPIHRQHKTSEMYGSKTELMSLPYICPDSFACRSFTKPQWWQMKYTYLCLFFPVLSQHNPKASREQIKGSFWKLCGKKNQFTGYSETFHLDSFQNKPTDRPSKQTTTTKTNHQNPGRWIILYMNKKMYSYLSYRYRIVKYELMRKSVISLYQTD